MNWKAPRTLPTTKEQWQLYDIPGAGIAARALTAALKRAEKACKSDENGGRKMSLGTAMNKIVYPVMSRYSKVGASDTEPRGVAIAYLESVTGQSYE